MRKATASKRTETPTDLGGNFFDFVLANDQLLQIFQVFDRRVDSGYFVEPQIEFHQRL